MIPQNGSVSSLPFAFQSMLIRPFLPADAEPTLALFRHTVKTVNRRDYSEKEVAAWLREEDVTPDMWLDSFTGKAAFVAIDDNGALTGFAPEKSHLWPSTTTERLRVLSTANLKPALSTAFLLQLTGREKASDPHFSHKRRPLLSAPFPRLPSTPL